jgi:hypothetical protein
MWHAGLGLAMALANRQGANMPALGTRGNHLATL